MKNLKAIVYKDWFIIAILCIAFFLRVYRVGDLTGFYFDQGRDAKIVWELWHSGKTFLIGPTTGIEGIFLGPFFYYLIAPFYLIGNGNPAAVSWALAGMNVIGIYFIYLIGKNFINKPTGILAAFLITFSLPLVQYHRWLSNPNPLPLFSAIAVYFIFKIINGSKSFWIWPFLGLVLGLSLQLEAASAVFFLPATGLIFLFFRKKIHWSKTIIMFFLGFGITLIPQAWFNFRHNNILVYAFQKFLISEKSFTPVLTNFFTNRLQFYFDAFSQKLFLDRSLALIFSWITLILGLASIRKLFKPAQAVLLIWCVTPLAVLLFYHGNNGYVWDYYFTGVYSLFVLLFASILNTAATQYNILRPLVGLIILVFLVTNIFHLHNYLSAGLNGETNVVIGNSIRGVDWIFKDAGDKPFNVDVYVPPVIPHAYDYLFLWRGTTIFHHLPKTELVPLLYTLYEQDPPFPDRLEAWKKRQAGIATPLYSQRFGGITVEKRIRIPNAKN